VLHVHAVEYGWRRTGVLLAGVAALLVGLSAGAQAAIYYVSPQGDDANAGTPVAPWRTLQKAGDVAGAGDDVVVLPGTYVGFRPRRCASSPRWAWW